MISTVSINRFESLYFQKSQETKKQPNIVIRACKRVYKNIIGAKNRLIYLIVSIAHRALTIYRNMRDKCYNYFIRKLDAVSKKTNPLSRVEIPVYRLIDRVLVVFAPSYRDMKIKYAASIVFVGAGPVGLWCAVQTKLINKKAKIVMLEKHKTYQRSHVLKIDWKSFLDRPLEDQRLNEMVKEFKKTPFIRTNTIETRLREYAKDLGIEIIHEEIKDKQSLEKKLPNANVIVGSDGAHSIVRKEVFGEKFAREDSLKYILEMKYEVKGRTKKLASLYKHQEVFKTKSLISEHIGRERDGKTPVTLRFFINKDEHQAMKAATFKSPFLWEKDYDKIPPSLKSCISSYLRKRKSQTQETPIVDSQKITVTKLGSYISKEFVVKDKKRTWVLVGDSAFGVPFFRSLNNGFRCGSILAKTLAKERQKSSVFPFGFGISSEAYLDTPYKGKPEQRFKDFATYMQVLAHKEADVASTKATALTSAETFVKGVGMINDISNYLFQPLPAKIASKKAA